MVKIIAAIFEFTATESWGEKAISTKGVNDSKKEGEGRGWGHMNFFTPLPTVHFNQSWPAE